MNARLNKYLRTRAIKGPWRLEGLEGRARQGYRAAVIIPALAEAETLPHTIRALSANPREELSQTLIVIVVNQRTTAAAELKADNRSLLKWLRSQTVVGVKLSWIDAASGSLELPETEGVGLARKIGFDLALSQLDWADPPLLVSLDADTLVDGQYLPAIFSHFASRRCGTAVLPFRHQSGTTEAQEEAIRRYELYLRAYRYGLALAGSPYAYHAIGSALACRADSYLAAGGMNRRQAAEDFYFLQQLAKVDGIEKITGTLVRPSARFSDRVPYGTGRVVEARACRGDQLYRFVSAASFLLLRQWLDLIREGLDRGGVELLRAAKGISPRLAGFLEQRNFVPVWDRLVAQHDQLPGRLRAFHHWFDALRTRQLLRRFEDEENIAAGTLVGELLCLGGYGQVAGAAEQLALMEALDGINAAPAL